ncbi:unnamed protein product, partial [Meganyctiphanes norvegica]
VSGHGVFLPALLSVWSPSSGSVCNKRVSLDLDQDYLGVLPDSSHLSDPGSSMRCFECSSGSGVQGRYDLNRVVSGQEIFQPALLSVWSASGGSVCDKRVSLDLDQDYLGVLPDSSHLSDPSSSMRCLNVLADQGSRKGPISTERSLGKESFSQL